MKIPGLTGARFVFPLTMLLTACNLTDNKPPDDATKLNNNHMPAITPASPTESLDLSITSAMTGQPQKQETDFLAARETPPVPFINTPKENDLSVSGKLYLADNEEDYFDAIEGPEITIEVRFE